ncbi:hypothetical protein ACOI1C_04450 [Bacillus sp. DJP31]|uniref:hypothetical protein n=1 Tax=Bacillus sp. DJP31 TaxID=3409789 RepID=UPI003BB698F2
MAHMITGIVFLLTALLLFMIDRYYTYVDFMSSFTEKGFKRLVGGLTLVGVLLFGFGVYSYVTYTPPFIRLEMNGEGYFVDGDLEKVGYIQNETQIYRLGEETSLLFVTWENHNARELKVNVKDEEGKEYDFPLELTSINNEFSTLVHEKSGTKSLFELSPIMLETAGNWNVSMTAESDNEIANFQIKVYEKEALE